MRKLMIRPDTNGQRNFYTLRHTFRTVPGKLPLRACPA
jgi:hypothetical protein